MFSRFLIRGAAGLVLVWAFLCNEGTHAQNDLPSYRVQNVATGDQLNLRAAAGTGAKVLETISPQTRDIVGTGRTERLGNQLWLEVIVNGLTGWVNARYLSPEPATTGTKVRRPAYLYDPIVLLGNKQAKRTIQYYRSAVDAQSLAVFNKHIKPLIKNNSKDTLVALISVLDIRRNDLRGPGALLLCPDDHAIFANLAMTYLQYGTDVENVSPIPGDAALFANEAIARLEKSGLLDLRACQNNARFHVRHLRAIELSKIFFSISGRTLPIIAIDGTPVALSDPKLVEILQGNAK